MIVRKAHLGHSNPLDQLHESSDSFVHHSNVNNYNRRFSSSSSGSADKSNEWDSFLSDGPRKVVSVDQYWNNIQAKGVLLINVFYNK